jgi:hypothetical protein
LGVASGSHSFFVGDVDKIGGGFIVKYRILKHLKNKKSIIEDYIYTLPNKKDSKEYYEHEIRDLDSEIEWLEKMVFYEPHEAKRIAVLVSKIKTRHPEDKYVQELFKEIQKEK